MSSPRINTKSEKAEKPSSASSPSPIGSNPSSAMKTPDLRAMEAQKLKEEWSSNPRWKNILRGYTAEDVIRMRGSGAFHTENSFAIRASNKLWSMLNSGDSASFVSALGAMTGNQALQQVKGGLKAIYLSGWQVAADQNNAGEMYPDQSLYPADSVPRVVKSLNKTLARADQIQFAEGKNPGDADFIDYAAPIVADAEAGFGGVLNAYELAKHLIEAGAAAVHFEDQLASAKKCGHLGGKVLVPTREGIAKLVAARLAGDVLNVPTILIARTDAEAADLITSDVDSRDKPFLTGARTAEGYYRTTPGIEQSISRALSYAPYCDMLWMETKTPNIEYARKFADAVHAKFPGKLLAYNCSPSFNWKKYLTDAEIASFQHDLAKLGYKFQFITLAGFHTLNYSMFELAYGYARTGMSSFVRLQQAEFEAAKHGFTAVKHQQEVGTGYFDKLMEVIQNDSATLALHGSTENLQFYEDNGTLKKPTGNAAVTAAASKLAQIHAENGSKAVADGPAPAAAKPKTMK